MAGLPYHAPTTTSRSSSPPAGRSRSATSRSPPGRASWSGAANADSLPRARPWPRASSTPRATTTSRPLALDAAGPARRLAGPVDRGVQGRDATRRSRTSSRSWPGSTRPSSWSRRASWRAGQAARTTETALHALHAFAARPALPPSCPPTSLSRPPGAQAVMEPWASSTSRVWDRPDHPGSGPPAPGRYATENLCAKPENLRGLQEYRSARTLLLDPATLRNLEIFSSSRGAATVRSWRRSTAPPPPRAPGCSSAGSPPRRSTSPRSAAGRRWSASLRRSPPPRGAARRARATSGTSPGSSAACRTACAIRGSLAVSATPSRSCPAIKADLARLRRRPGRAGRTPACQRTAGAAAPARPRPRRRPADRPRRRQLHPRRPRRRARPPARAHPRQQDLALRPRAPPSSNARDPQPEGQVHRATSAITSR